MPPTPPKPSLAGETACAATCSLEDGEVRFGQKRHVFIDHSSIDIGVMDVPSLRSNDSKSRERSRRLDIAKLNELLGSGGDVLTRCVAGSFNNGSKNTWNDRRLILPQLKQYKELGFEVLQAVEKGAKERSVDSALARAFRECTKAFPGPDHIFVLATDDCKKGPLASVVDDARRCGLLVEVWGWMERCKPYWLAEHGEIAFMKTKMLKEGDEKSRTAVDAAIRRALDLVQDDPTKVALLESIWRGNALAPNVSGASLGIAGYATQSLVHEAKRVIFLYSKQPNQIG